jgi:TPR repeat protein
MPVDRALPAAHDRRSRFSLVVAIIGGGSSPTLRLGLPFALATVMLLALLVGAGYSGPLAPQAQTAQQQNALTAGELKALQQKAEQGDAEAQCTLGFLYRKGQGVPQDDAQAVAWTRKAAEQGHARAQFNLAIVYYNGYGIPRDPAQAVSWIRKAAEQGHAEAQFNLGGLYVDGEGVPKDNTQAAVWYREAAEQGDAEAQFNLAVFYRMGQGVPLDLIEAVKWSTIAMDRLSGDQQKANAAFLEGTARMLTAERLAEAQKRASEWTAAFEKRKK